jgi:hypothetical protein
MVYKKTLRDYKGRKITVPAIFMHIFAAENMFNPGIDRNI